MKFFLSPDLVFDDVLQKYICTKCEFTGGALLTAAHYARSHTDAEFFVAYRAMRKLQTIRFRLKHRVMARKRRTSRSPRKSRSPVKRSREQGSVSPLKL